MWYLNNSCPFVSKMGDKLLSKRVAVEIKLMNVKHVKWVSMCPSSNLILYPLFQITAPLLLLEKAVPVYFAVSTLKTQKSPTALYHPAIH